MKSDEVLKIVKGFSKVHIEGMAELKYGQIYFKGVVGVYSGSNWITRENKMLCIRPVNIVDIHPVDDDALLSDYPTFYRFKL